jgi:hypothetical protein
VFSKDDLVVIGVKLEEIVLKVGSVLSKELLEGFFVFLIGARLIYFVGLCLLSRVEKINLLLEGCNLGRHVLSIVVIITTRGG